MRNKLKRFWQWLRKNALNKETFVFFVIAELIFWLPCIVTGLFAVIINPWWWTAFGAICAFWAGPFTPAIPLQLALTVGLKKLWSVLKNKRKKIDNNEQL